MLAGETRSRVHGSSRGPCRLFCQIPRDNSSFPSLGFTHVAKRLAGEPWPGV